MVHTTILRIHTFVNGSIALHTREQVLIQIAFAPQLADSSECDVVFSIFLLHKSILWVHLPEHMRASLRHVKRGKVELYAFFSALHTDVVRLEFQVFAVILHLVLLLKFDLDISEGYTKYLNKLFCITHGHFGPSFLDLQVA